MSKRIKDWFALKKPAPRIRVIKKPGRILEMLGESGLLGTLGELDHEIKSSSAFDQNAAAVHRIVSREYGEFCVMFGIIVYQSRPESIHLRLFINEHCPSKEPQRTLWEVRMKAGIEKFHKALRLPSSSPRAQVGLN